MTLQVTKHVVQCGVFKCSFPFFPPVTFQHDSSLTFFFSKKKRTHSPCSPAGDGLDIHVPFTPFYSKLKL